jgi:hypothetical protein
LPRHPAFKGAPTGIMANLPNTFLFAEGNDSTLHAAWHR